jgi:transcription-repair coupling factor (superfamily II helicase)
MKLTDLVKIEYKNNMGIAGLTDGFFACYLANLLEQEQRNILVVVNSIYEANQLMNNVESYTNHVRLFPMDDFLTSEALAISPDLEITRLETINEILKEDSTNIIITNLMGYLHFLPSKEEYLKHNFKISKDMDIDPSTLVKKLSQAGYVRDINVNKTGDFAVRGFVIDVYPIDEDNPVRIEFFGDNIESIRYFDGETQKSLNNISEVLIKPYFEFLTSKEVKEEEFGKQKYLARYSLVASIYDYIDKPLVLFKDYKQLELGLAKIMDEVDTYRETKDNKFKDKYMFNLKDIKVKDAIYYMNINNISKNNISTVIDYKSKTIDNFNENIDAINSYIDKKINDNKTIVVALKDYQLKSISKFINRDVTFTDRDHLYLNKINMIKEELREGFSYDDLFVITAHELFKENMIPKRYKTKFKYSSSLKAANKLTVGDYVVHNVHGIGVYNGIKTLSFNGVEKDYLEILYQGSDKVYIPVEKINSLYKYSGKEGVIPKINKLGSAEWEKTKSRVKKKVNDMADRLLKLYAERESKKGFAFSKDDELTREFEALVPFELTKGQEQAIKDIKKDMESIQPMDRLLCGDVGFGKTEVAFVAAFKAIHDSKQVLFLCPTTILSNQHYENAKERFKEFPVNIALLNRFTSHSETKKILEGLSDGTIDMVIGTHRLLSNDIKPKDLGLLIVDEEQRFGVSHKEKIKEFKSNVDVLTLTATPIPRTLQMSITGIRSLSLIETPPVNRYPIQTYVVEEDEQILRDAVYKELARHGQTFILYNRVQSIADVSSKLKLLLPDARIVYVHGQMNKEDLEGKLMDFIDYQYDVLVCTTIIETGIDIPNVNTLIIMDADMFGLSQLYQIRGRVGRSDKFAYAYLMYKKAKILTDTAIKRLNVIKEFTELGSGFSIATRDLSIRGAGDILGSEQAGFIDSVGIDLYLKMLNDEVARREGKKVSAEDTSLTKALIDVTTHIDDNYVSDDELKIEIHQKINEIDSLAKIKAVKAELEDRFGHISNDMVIYMYEEWFEKLASKLNITNVRQTRNYIELIFPEETVKKLDTEELFMDACNISRMFRFISRGSNLVIILDTINLEKHPIYYLDLLLEKIVSNLSN